MNTVSNRNIVMFTKAAPQRSMTSLATWLVFSLALIFSPVSLLAEENTEPAAEIEMNEVDSGFEGLNIRINRNKDAPPPKVNIKFKEGYKRTDLKDRPQSNYKRTILLELPAESSEAEQIDAIRERCQRYASDQKPFYFVTIINKKNKNQERTLSCDDEQLLTAKP